jgi:tripartite-type tricarboxylate transporter receptor subunit TctC
MAEAGINGQEAETMQGLLAPAGTPKAITDRLHREVVRIVTQPEMRDKLLSMGFDPVGNTPEQFSAYMNVEIMRWGKVVRDAKIKIE